MFDFLDVNNDSYVDLIVPFRWVSEVISWVENDGTNNWTTSHELHNHSGMPCDWFGEFELIDMNADAQTDIFLGSQYSCSCYCTAQWLAATANASATFGEEFLNITSSKTPYRTGVLGAVAANIDNGGRKNLVLSFQRAPLMFLKIRPEGNNRANFR